MSGIASPHVTETMILKALGPVRDLLFDDDVTEVVINGHQHVFYERSGRMTDCDARFASPADLDVLITLLAQHSGRVVGTNDFELDTALQGPPALRVHANFGASAPKGACVTLRRIAQATTTLADLVNQRESLSAEAAEFLLLAVGSHKNILVSGGTGSGKTTLLRCLCEGIPLHERIVLIEDTAELTFRQPDVVSLLTRPADGYGEGAITIRDLFKSALRLRPDRVIIGEIRGAEAFDLLQALGSGHSGALCTVHADSPFLALSRIHALASMSGLPVPSSVLHRQIQEVLHYVVQVDRAGSGARRVAGIARVEESHEGNWALTQVFDRQVTGGGAATLTWAGNADPWLDRIPVDALRKAAPTLVEVMLRGRASSS